MAHFLQRATRKIGQHCPLLHILASFIFLLVLSTNTAQASHYRYGSITWNRANDVTRTVSFTINQAWRRTYYTVNFGDPVTVGSTVNTQVALNFGDATAQVPIILTVTSVNLAEDFFTGTATINHTYSGVGNMFTASYLSNARLSTLSNNADQPFQSITVVNLGPGSIGSPVSTLPAIVNVPTGNPAATFSVPAVDPDGTPLTYRLSTAAEMQAPTQPAGLSINSTTGVATINTVGKPVGSLHNGAFTILDASGALTMTDFIIRIVNPSNPPVFDYAVTPLNNFNYNIQPGQNLSFNVKATDPDAGSSVSISAAGLPAGVTFTPPLPTAPANPTTTNFSWTPTNAQLGVYVVSFIATDEFNIQTTTTVTISVNTNPVFIVPPTPIYDGDYLILTGVLHVDNISAANPDPSVNTQIFSASIPAGATITPALPTAFAAIANTTLSWTPTPADWGSHQVIFTARDANNKTTSHQYYLVVNTAPAFTSMPVTNVEACHTYSYNIAYTDADFQYGDQLEIEHSPLPAWLTLTDNEDGTGTLSGTPTGADVGTYNITLTAADLYHHGSPLVQQTFTITVGADATPPTAVCKNATVTLAGGTASITPADIDNGSSDACGPVNLVSVTPNTFTCADAGSVPVVLMVSDGNGNTSTCSATVLVQGASPGCSIAVTPSNNIYTGGVPTNIYLGYGPQSATATVNATGGSGFSYIWSGPVASLSCTTCKSPVFTPTMAGTYTYTVTVTNANGCTTTCSVTFCVKNIISDSKNKKVYICHVPEGNPGNANTLSVSVNAVPSHLAHGDQLGMCGQSCGSTANKQAPGVNLIMGDELAVKAYPNPFTDGIHIRIESNAIDIADLVITDLTGRTLEVRRAQRVGSDIVVGSALANGLYIVEVRSSNLSQKIRIVKTQ